MENKLGIYNSNTLHEAQRKIIKTKLSVLDETFTFNLREFDFEYLVRMHKYLFCDFYSFKFDSALDFPKDIYEDMEEIMKSIRLLCIYSPEDKNTLIELLYQLWEMQAFTDGNTRTILGFFKVLNHAFNLGFNIDVTREMPLNFMDFENRMCIVNETKKNTLQLK